MFSPLDQLHSPFSVHPGYLQLLLRICGIKSWGECVCYGLKSICFLSSAYFSFLVTMPVPNFNLLTSSSDCWVFLCVVVGSLPHSIKWLQVTVVVIWRFIKNIALNWSEPPSAQLLCILCYIWRQQCYSWSCFVVEKTHDGFMFQLSQTFFYVLTFHIRK